MYICIGGPWHMGELLEKNKRQKAFRVKDKLSGVEGMYRKRIITIKDQKYTFWVFDSMSDFEADEIIKNHLIAKYRIGI